MKKAAKGCKGYFKGPRVKKWKNIDFIAFLCSFGVKNEEDSVFWRFKVIKAKKATLVARKAKSQRSNAKNLWLVLYCLYVIFVLSQRSILLYFWGPKIKETKKNIKAKLRGITILIQMILQKFWIFFHFWAPQGLFWPLKGLNLKSRAKLTFGIVQ